MECARSLELLSEYYADALDEKNKTGVSTHLAECPPCKGIFIELTVIVETAFVLREAKDTISFPDEWQIWQRMKITEHSLQ